ncbi:matrilin-2-like [Lineus longissimus]|uniref:matrilin-2-like n=1 Tax=Lineus longissimus TaxID=88925 RepID=UPI00315D8DF4
MRGQQTIGLCLLALGTFLSQGHGVVAEDPRCDSEADIVFILDASGSVGDPNFEKMRDFVEGMVRKLALDSGAVRVGLLSYSFTADPVFNLNDHSSNVDVLLGIQGMGYSGGGTSTAVAIKYARETMFTVANGDRSSAKNIAVVVTDGKSSDPAGTLAESALAHDAGITLFALGIGDAVDTDELKGIASDPDEEYMYRVSSFDVLSSVSDTIVDGTCYVPEPPTTTEAITTPEATTIMPTTTPVPTTTSTTMPETTMTLAPTTTPEPTTMPTSTPVPIGCSTMADIVFIVDGSGSVGDAEFPKMQQFVVDIVSDFDIDSGAIRVGLMSYSFVPNLHFHLNGFTNKADILTGIKNMPYNGGGTYTGQAIEYARDTMFTAANGERSHAPNIIIILTDGDSNEFPNTVLQSQLAHQDNITIFAIGIGKGIGLTELQAIATDPDSKYMFQVNNFDALDSIKEAIMNKACEAAVGTTTVPPTTTPTTTPATTVPTTPGPGR